MTAGRGPTRRLTPLSVRYSTLAACACALLTLLPQMLSVAFFWWVNRPLPPPPIDRRVLPRPNGFDACVAAVRRLKPTPKDSPILRWNAPPADVRRALLPDRAALHAVRQAMRLEYVTPPMRDYRDQFPYLEHYWDAGRRFVAESRLALAEGKPGTAIERALDAVELGSQTGRGGGVYHNLTASALAIMGVGQAGWVVDSLSAAEARAAGRRLDRITRRFPLAADAAREERRAALATARGVFNGEIEFNEMTGTEEPATEGFFPAELWAFYPRAQAYVAVDRAFQEVIVELEKPYPQRQPVREPDEPVAGILATSEDLISLSFLRRDVFLRLLRVKLELQEYARRHGRFPNALAQLTPETLPTLPLDPCTEKTLVYRPWEETYLLYSLGPDQNDDFGSRLPETGLTRKSRGDFAIGRLLPRPARGR
ncbi:MAG TPA: hypothetical protein VK689_21725 [Armatimonadota bacterium]|nr:hypothetical protein [Armatimonadota bacterium]